jgi:cell division protein FtsB
MKQVAAHAVLLSLQASMLFYAFMYGRNGWYKLTGLRQEVKALAWTSSQCEHNIHVLQEKIERWSTDPFYKEKIAREQLHLARAHDEIFYINR